MALWSGRGKSWLSLVLPSGEGRAVGTDTTVSLWDWLLSTGDGQLVLAAVVGAVFGFLFFLFRLLRAAATAEAKRIKSRERDKLAKAVGACLNSGQPPPAFALYLRPFRSTGYQYANGVAAALATEGIARGGVSVWQAIASSRDFKRDDGAKAIDRVLLLLMIVMVTAFAVDWTLWNGYLIVRRARLNARARKLANHPLAEHGDVVADFEDLLEDGVARARKISLIALGNPGEVIGGAGRLRVKDEEWQDHIRFMMEHSSLNVLVLSPRPGTLWEIEQTLAQGYWKKTLFVQPPAGGVAMGAYAPDTDYDGVKAIFAKYSARIPDRDRRGVAFGYGDLGKPPSVKANIRSLSALVASCRMVGGVSVLANLYTTQFEAEPPIPGMPNIKLDEQDKSVFPPLFPS